MDSKNNKKNNNKKRTNQPKVDLGQDLKLKSKDDKKPKKDITKKVDNVQNENVKTPESKEVKNETPKKSNSPKMESKKDKLKNNSKQETKDNKDNKDLKNNKDNKLEDNKKNIFETIMTTIVLIFEKIGDFLKDFWNKVKDETIKLRNKMFKMPKENQEEPGNTEGKDVSQNKEDNNKETDKTKKAGIFATIGLFFVALGHKTKDEFNKVKNKMNKNKSDKQNNNEVSGSDNKFETNNEESMDNDDKLDTSNNSQEETKVVNSKDANEPRRRGEVNEARRRGEQTAIIATKDNKKKTDDLKENNGGQPLSKKQKRKLKKKNRPLWKKLLFLFIKLGLIFFVIGLIILGTYIFAMTGQVKTSDFEDLKAEHKVFDNEKSEITTYNEIDYVTLKDVSPYYTEALLATEDQRFYKHFGLDVQGMSRAVLGRVVKGNRSGGSTLTMQLAKLLYLSGEPKYDENGQPITDENNNIIMYGKPDGIDYKLKQIALAIKIEQKFSKEQILEAYVNEVEFKFGMRGIENGSEYFFGKKAKDLTLSQAALLAGMTQGQSSYNPYLNYDLSIKRRDVVLGRMLAEKKISQEEYDKAIKENIKEQLVDHTGQADDYILYAAYLSVVESNLRKLTGDDKITLRNSEAKIYTTLDKKLQKQMYNVINNKSGNIRYPDKFLQAAAVTVDNNSGGILAMIGERIIDGASTGQDHASVTEHQPGSTAKPIVDYGPAIEYLNWTTKHKLYDRKIYYSGGGAQINNASGTYSNKSVTMQEGLAKSLNTTAVYTFQQVQQLKGKATIENFMKKLGIKDSEDKNVTEAYAIGGWEIGTTPLEMAGAYSAFANGGKYTEPHALDYVVFSESSPYYEKFQKGKDKVSYEEFATREAMENSTAFMITKMLSPTVPGALTAQIYAMGTQGLGQQAIKTGTSNWGEEAKQYGIPDGAPRDKWVAGYSNDVTTVMWSGYAQFEVKGFSFGQTGNEATDYGLWSYDIYAALMRNVINRGKYVKNTVFTQPSDVESIGGGYYAKKGTKEEYIKTAEDEKAEQLAELQEMSEAMINGLGSLTDRQKKSYIARIGKATSRDAMQKIIDEASSFNDKLEAQEKKDKEKEDDSKSDDKDKDKE